MYLDLSNKRFRKCVVKAWLVVLGLCASQMQAQTFTDPAVTATFSQATQGMALYEDFEFGTGSGRNFNNLQRLAAFFSPYGISGLTVINQEWERYQGFNSQNFVFTANTLNLTATIPASGGLFPGGINSGQIWTNEVYQPDVTGHTIYAFEVSMQIPSGPGTWPAAWFYTKVPGENDGSEIDNPEFFVMNTQNDFDWTGFDHGPGMGAQIYSIKTNQWVWQPGINFSAAFHDYQTFWTPNAVYKYVDGTLVYAQSFTWTAKGAPQLGINLAIGSNDPTLAGLKPTSLSQFPCALSIDHIKVWVQ
jgi:Glycosyl hydrolases family 16